MLQKENNPTKWLYIKKILQIDGKRKTLQNKNLKKKTHQKGEKNNQSNISSNIVNGRKTSLTNEDRDIFDILMILNKARNGRLYKNKKIIRYGLYIINTSKI